MVVTFPQKRPWHILDLLSLSHPPPAPWLCLLNTSALCWPPPLLRLPLSLLVPLRGPLGLFPILPLPSTPDPSTVSLGAGLPLPGGALEAAFM